MERSCNNCKSTLQDFYKNRKTSCPYCFDFFGMFAFQFIEAHNNFDKFPAKKNKSNNSKESKKNNILSITPEKHLEWTIKLYNKCIKQEDYETCMEIKEIIPELKKLVKDRLSYKDALQDAFIDQDDDRVSVMKKKNYETFQEAGNLLLDLRLKFDE